MLLYWLREFYTDTPYLKLKCSVEVKIIVKEDSLLICDLFKILR